MTFASWFGKLSMEARASQQVAVNFRRPRGKSQKAAPASKVLASSAVPLHDSASMFPGWCRWAQAA